MPQSETVSHPVIGAAENGLNSVDAETTYFDTYGRPRWTQDADGFLTVTAYEPFTGAVIETIQDVDSSLTSEFSDKPSTWTTPTGGGLNLITQYTVDGLGRTIEAIDPNGNVTYTVYDDVNHEVR